MKIKRWYHYVLEFFGVNTGVWYRFRFTASVPAGFKGRIVRNTEI